MFYGLFWLYFITDIFIHYQCKEKVRQFFLKHECDLNSYDNIYYFFYFCFKKDKMFCLDFTISCIFSVVSIFVIYIIEFDKKNIR